MVQTALKQVEPQLSTHKIGVQVNLSYGLPRILADPNQLLQVFLHIASNALQALDEGGGGTLCIESSSQDSFVVLQFHCVAVFPGPLPTFDPSADTPGDGRSTTLSACHSIIREYEGHISCVKEAEAGTRIRIELPIPEMSNANAEVAQASCEVARTPEGA